MSKGNNSNGKGSAPRSCFSKEFKSNYDNINWSNAKSAPVVNSSDSCVFCGSFNNLKIELDLYGREYYVCGAACKKRK